MKRILVLYAEVMPYTVAVIRELVKSDCFVYVVRWTNNNLTPYIPPSLLNVIYYDRSTFNTHKELLLLIEDIKPDLIWTSGWMDKMYCKAAGVFRKKSHIPVLAGSDTQWKGGKQWLNVIFSSFRHKCWFSHILITGLWQYEYARRLGFSQYQILQPNYSADTSLFFKVDIEKKKKLYPKNLLFVGRFSEVKGLLSLLSAWKSISDKKAWNLTLIGNGSLKEVLQEYSDITVKDFMSQEDLVMEMQNSGALILPSIFEPWALVLHEAAAAGLPILASRCCGAVPYFVLENYNGYLFVPDDIASIDLAINRLINSSDEQLITMSYRSRELSRRITPDIVANSLLSVL